MYAVIETGGKQYRVGVGDVIRVEKLEAEAGDNVSLSQVLMVNNNGEVRVGACVPTHSSALSPRTSAVVFIGSIWA